MFCTDAYSIKLFQSLSLYIFSPEAPPLLYYSHVPAAAIAVILSFFIIYKNREALEAKILVTISLLYAGWAVMNLFIWTQIDIRVVTYLWSFWFTIFSLIFVLSFYFLYAFIKKSDAPFKVKLLFALLLLPIILLQFTPFNLSYFDVSGCNALENPFMIGYAYLLTTIVFISMVVFAFHQYYKAEKENKRPVMLVSVGVLLFLLSFSIATYIPSVLNLFESTVDTFDIEMYGFFGMTLFIGFLSYLIVRYKAFNIKLLAAQALVLALVALIASEFFFVTSAVNRILVSITLFLSVAFGFLLVRSVKREIKHREELQEANAGQENLIHIMNHQIKGYLGKGRTIFAELASEPDYCAADAAKPMISEGLKSMVDGVDFIQQVLNGSNAARGTLTYTMKPMDFKALVLEVAGKQKGNADEKKLSYTVQLPETPVTMTADELQLKEAVKNLIDNSIRYTLTGGLTIKLESNLGKALLTIKDTGIGIDAEDKVKLFTKGGKGKDSLKYNVNSTGYGLAFVKGVVDAHKGRVWVESDGPGKGSTFFMELPQS